MTAAFARVWTVLAAGLAVAGWVLSLVGHLDRAGYAVALPLIAIAAWVAARGGEPCRWRLPRWRFRRIWPRLFAGLCVLIVLGALLHAPNNFDALAYRIPRTLHWLAEGHWFWIETIYQRLNVRGTGTEWMMAPLLLFTRTDRAVWLLNFLPFLALPGLVFSTFVRAGVRPKVAFRWMWLIPSAYILAGQAGGSANDLPSAFFALAAIDFALRARQSGRCADVWFSALAMAVLTNWKVSNSPLGLVWLAAVWPALPLLAGKPFKSAAVAVAALLASTIPTAVLNQYYCGDWTGAKLDVPGKPSDRPPGLVLGTNLLNIAVRNLTPPLFPWASQWNRWSRSVQPESYRREVARIFGDRMEPTDVSELPDEERGNFGFGLTVLLIVGAIANLRSTNSIGPPRKFFWIWFTPWVALAVLLWNMPVDAVPRHIAGYYPLLALGIVAGRAQHLLIRRRWWNGLATLAYLSGFIPVVLAPTRPLWPAQTILGALVERYPHSVLLERARQTFQTYASRARVLDPIAKWIPEGEKVVGLVAHNQIETSLWRPFGERTIVHVPPSASREEILRRGIRVVVVHEITLQMMENFRYLDWLVQHQDMDLLGEAQIRTYSAAPAERWIVYRLRDGDRGSQ